MRTLLMSTVMASMLVLGAGAARAGMTGDSILEEYQFPNPGNFYAFQTATVGAGVEFPSIEGVFQADFTDTQLIMTFNTTTQWTPSAQNGPTFIDQTNAFTGFSIDAATTALWFNGSMIALDNTGALGINWQGQFVTNGETVVLDLTTDAPEPASMAILGAGLVGLGMARRRRM